MGKRKKSSRKPQGPRRKDPLPTQFTCLFCNHEKSVTVKLDKKAGVGLLDCKVCGQRFQCAINYLSAAVDVYGEWVDAADSVAKEDAGTIDLSRKIFRTPTTGPPKEAEEPEEAEDPEGDAGYEGEGIVGDDVFD